jgi:hypothetical protein
LGLPETEYIPSAQELRRAQDVTLEKLCKDVARIGDATPICFLGELRNFNSKHGGNLLAIEPHSMGLFENGLKCGTLW